MEIGNFSRRAFTLVELMISLAMALLLILGINYVFRSATDAVGAGQATNGINADAQSSQPVLFDDLRNVSKNPPCFIISSQLVTQFLNADDAKNGSDPNVIPTDNAGNYAFISNSSFPGDTTPKPTYLTPGPQQYISPALLNSRNHRADLLKFFAHGLYQRRSGPDGTYYAADTSEDAYIELGHAALPANDLSAFYGPSALPVGNTGYTNYTDQLTPAQEIAGVPRAGAYASEWVLARRATLLKDPNSIPENTPGTLSLTNDTVDPFYTTGNGVPVQTTATAFAVNMAPLSYGTPDTNPPGTQFQSSRYDLAGVTPEEFDRIIANAILGWQNAATPYSGTSLWWNPLVYGFQMTQTVTTPPQYYQMTASATNLNGAMPPYVIPYTNTAPLNTGPPLPASTPPQTDPGLWYARTQCNPAIQSPVSSASIAEMAPYFLQHCSQFIVEYAGDYMQQDDSQYLPSPPNSPNTINPHYGAMTGIGPDGQIDYYVDANGNKHIRWYGMPRSSTGTIHSSDATAANSVLIRGYNQTAATPDNPTAPGAANTYDAALNYFTDVIPLRDYYSMWFNTANTDKLIYSPPWEVDVNFDPTLDYGSYLPANAPVANTSGNNNAFNNPNNPPRYVAAWHDDMPAMIRILIKVDDPNNKVKDGPWYEYVFKLK